MASPNEARKAIYMRFIDGIKDGGELSLSCLALRTPPDEFTGGDRADAIDAIDDVNGISDLAPFDADRNLAVILTATDPEPDEKYYFALRPKPPPPPPTTPPDPAPLVWTNVTDEVTVLSRALEPPPGAMLHGSPSLSRRITFDNEKFDEPIDGRWVRLAVRHTGRSQESLGGEGNRRFRSYGSVFVQVFTEAGERTLVADCIAQKIVEMFDVKSFDGLAFEAASSSEGGPEGKWNMVIVEAPFSYDEVK